jgi:hypothetical protein
LSLIVPRTRNDATTTSVGRRDTVRSGKSRYGEEPASPTDHPLPERRAEAA